VTAYSQNHKLIVRYSLDFPHVIPQAFSLSVLVSWIEKRGPALPRGPHTLRAVTVPSELPERLP